MVSRLQLWQTVCDRLDAIPHVDAPKITVYRGEIPNPPPLLKVDIMTDPSRRVAPYLVANAGSGNPLVEPDLADTADELDWPLYLVVAAGFEDDVLDAVDRVHEWLFRWSPVIDGTVCGALKPPPGFESTIRRFDQVQPIRFEMPLQYRLVATRD